MNLDDLLKVNSVRCIKTKVQEDLVEGEIYKDGAIVTGKQIGRAHV